MTTEDQSFFKGATTKLKKTPKGEGKRDGALVWAAQLSVSGWRLETGTRVGGVEE